jgi:hypothetical protein
VQLRIGSDSCAETGLATQAMMIAKTACFDVIRFMSPILMLLEAN